MFESSPCLHEAIMNLHHILLEEKHIKKSTNSLHFYNLSLGIPLHSLFLGCTISENIGDTYWFMDIKKLCLWILNSSTCHMLKYIAGSQAAPKSCKTMRRDGF